MGRIAYRGVHSGSRHRDAVTMPHFVGTPAKRVLRRGPAPEIPISNVWKLGERASSDLQSEISNLSG